MDLIELRALAGAVTDGLAPSRDVAEGDETPDVDVDTLSSADFLAAIVTALLDDAYALRQIAAQVDGELFRVVFTVEDVTGILDNAAENDDDLGVELDVAVGRVSYAASVIQETLIERGNEALYNAISIPTPDEEG